ncbi:hypothetical protein J2T56_000112 [Natronobacillus azotifigens]|uniref:Uncharacterized protein n=1 Tax=Natronobacillus azotifigens TaxID=472978 RepID=A0A9J6R804_9BACI|nr:hypothetical protein [Natronobacillus azotifigens]MCZ0701679.1 hypothetical protein [Natronobacillus azotifigens]
MKKITGLLILVVILLVACGSNDLFDNPVTEIEVRSWEDRERIGVIDDEEFIEGLVEELENANTATTANLDVISPDYHLVFFHNDEVIKELGYYEQEKNFGGVTGRYIDFPSGDHYGVTTELTLIRE